MEIAMRSSFVSFSLLRRALPWFGGFLAASVLAQGVAPVPTVQIQVRSVSTGYEHDGVIQPVRQSTVSAQASGRIVALAVKAGDRVKAGQLLATIDDREAAVGVQRSQAQLMQSEAELRNAQVNLERTRELQAKGFVSKAALDVAETQFKGAQAGRAQADAGARQSGLMQGYTRVVAPYDGWVLQTHADAGDLAVPGKPIMTVYAPQPLRAVVYVPASRADAARQASQVEVQIPDAQGQLQWISPAARSSGPAADPVSQTVEWRLELAPKQVQHLLAGQQVRVRFAGTQQASRLVVPAAAVLRRGELTAVYVASDKGFALRAVRLGVDHGADGVEVVAGLQAGEHVALDPVKAGLAGAKAAVAEKR
jgi:RND family efflux transporter MFP subunit